MIIINDINDEKIRHYRSLRFTPLSHKSENIFITEGEKVTLKLLRSNLKVISIFALSEFYQKYNDLIELKEIHDEMKLTAEKKIMEEIVGFNLHSGFMAMAEKPEDTKPEDMDKRIIMLNGIIDAENVGSIVRNASAFGFSSIIADKGSSSPFLRRSVRVSMGSIFSMKVRHINSFDEIISNFKNKLGYKIIAAELTDNAADINEYEFPGKYILIFGSEGKGIHTDILNRVDQVVKIPIFGEIESLNVAVSNAVFLYEINKRN
jgi:tRNA G18 (ribose-2'-O)-methylase SpoU